ncbi:metallophosphoesterase family protein [Salisediminibacterium beveridgei]|uniref:DNA repair exonuclease family protein YhaO n=1 Tax=Salisediminibacterium beveridgei TaxID=632773 RepID=A0A1D7QTX0_9BACI|nr:DNA repair exonuclease [Salisediminibacterium beveridgei]AOM82450.1 DNA repair exonuclease family protein YhaO [Salisediminibacterium beveridgei]
MISFIHCADLHLGRPVKTNSNLKNNQEELVKEAAYRSFEKMVDEALAEEVDFVLIAGDLFDEEVRSLRGQWFIKRQCERLNEKGIAVYISHGNHDPLIEEEAVGYPANVKVFPVGGETFFYRHESGETLAISGFSYPQKEFTEKAKAYFPNRTEDATWHIGVLHGQAGNSASDHAPYAPFNLSELRNLRYDYWALGHIHKRMTLSEEPPVYYPGNMQGAHRKESGEKGYLKVSISGGVFTASFKATAPVQYQNVHVDVSGTEQLDDIVQRFADEVQAFPLAALTIVTVMFFGETSRFSQFVNSHNNGELKELLQEGLGMQEEVIIDTIRLKGLVDHEAAERLREDSLYRDLLSIRESLRSKEDWFKDITTDLERNARYRKVSAKLGSVQEDQEIADEAVERVTSALIQKEADRS